MGENCTVRCKRKSVLSPWPEQSRNGQEVGGDVCVCDVRVCVCVCVSSVYGKESEKR